MAYRLHIRLDRELNREIREYAEKNGLTTSQAARELLRQVLESADPVDRGWREGYMQGMGQGNRDYQVGAHRAKEATAVKARPFFADARRR